MPVEIRVNDIGPVVEFEYALEGYGLHVLKGKNGAGKTTITRVAELAVDGRTDGKLTHRDGTRRGEAYVAGHTIRISKQTRIEGELTIEGLGDLSIADLHTPKFQKASTRDEHRIKTLVRIAGVKADASLFEPLLGERFYEIVSVDALKTDDVLDMAQRVKRAIESEAQRVEKRRETELADARAQASIAESVDLSLPRDERRLQGDLEQAIQASASANAALNTLYKRLSEAKETTSRAAQARERLEQIGGGLTVAEAEAKLEGATTAQEALARVVERRQRALDDAMRALEEAKGQFEIARGVTRAASDAVTAAKREEAMHGELTAAIEAAKGLEVPSEDEFEAAAERAVEAELAVEAAKTAVTTGVKVRQALEAQAKSERHMDRANELSQEARRLRAAARDTFDVLSHTIGSINDCPLRVKLDDDMNARLVISTERSNEEYFDELSDGLRWSVIIGIAAKANRLIVLPQAAFGELSPSAKMHIHKLAQENSCYVLSAQADDCELHGESYGRIAMEAAE